MPDFSSANPFGNQQQGGLAQVMDLVSLVRTIQSVREQQTQTQEQDAKKAAIEKATGMPFADFQAQLAHMAFTGDQEQAQKARDYAAYLSTHLGPDSKPLTPGGVAGSNAFAQYTQDQNTINSVEPTTNAMRAIVEGRRQQALAALQDIGGDNYSTIQQLKNTHPDIGAVAAASLPLPASAQGLQKIVESIPTDLSNVPLPALHAMHDQLTQGIQTGLALHQVEAQGRTMRAPEAYKVADYQQQYDMALQDLKAAQSETTAILGNTSFFANPQQLGLSRAHEEAVHQRVERAGRALAAAKLGLAISPNDMPSPAPPAAGSSVADGSSGLLQTDKERMAKALRDAALLNPGITDDKELAKKAVDIYLQTKK